MPEKSSYRFIKCAALENHHGKWNENQRHEEGHVDKYRYTAGIDRFGNSERIGVNHGAVDAGRWCQEAHQRKKRDQGRSRLDVRQNALQIKCCHDRFHRNGYRNIIQEVG